MAQTMTPVDETARLNALRGLEIMDTAPELEFEALVNAAALVCGKPISLISLIEQDRQWFKANVGLPGITETPREVSFCTHAICGDDIMIIEDASVDVRTAANPVVTGGPGIRFYAGVPLALRTGEKVGTLCVIDRKPGTLSKHQREVLTHLGYAAARALEGRIALKREREMRLVGLRAASILENSVDAIVTTGLDGIIKHWNTAAEAMFGYTAGEAVGQLLSFLLPEQAPREAAGDKNAGKGNETLRRTKSGANIAVSISAGPVVSPKGETVGRTEIIRDVSESVEARRVLNAERQRLHNILDSTQAGTWEWNICTGEIRLNERWAQMIGYELAELQPVSFETWVKLLHPEDLEVSSKVLQEHVDGKSEGYKYETRLRHKDGSWVWVLTRGKVISRTADGKPEWMFGTHQDITERKLQEDRLRASQTFLDRTGRVAGVGGWQFDLRTSEITWTDETCRILGVEPGYVPQLDEAIDFYAPEARPVIRAAIEECVQTGKGWDLQLPSLRADGKPIWVRAVGSAEMEDGKPVRLSGAFQDISEQVRQRIALELLHDRQAVATENGRIGIWDADFTSGTTHYSEMWCNLIGYTRKEIGEAVENWLEFVHPDDRDRARNADLDHIAGKTPFFEEQFRMRHKDGSWIWILDRGKVIARDECGKPTRMIGTHVDITRQKQAEQEQALLAERITIATDSGGIGIWDYDLITDELTWDTWMYRLFGLTRQPGDCVRDIWRRHVYEEDRARVDAASKVAVEKLGGLEEEYRITHPDGTIHHLRVSARVIPDEAGRPVRLTGAAWDVTNMRRLAIELEEQHELMRVTLHSIGDAVMTTNAAGLVDWLNPVAEKMTGWTTSEAKGMPSHSIFNIVNEETRQTAPDPVRACLQFVDVVGLDYNTLLIGRDGREFSVEDSAAPIRNSKGETLGAVLVFHDVSEQRRLSREMSHRASHDPLTGLINRAEFDRRLTALFDKARIEESENALLYIDLDQFKIVNDSCGHAVGDELLKQVSKLLSDTIRTGDTLARLGGDEFAVLLEHCSIENATRIAQKMCDRMNDFRFVHGDQSFRVGTSIGIVPVGGTMPSIAAILQAADSCCYAAKEAGRNRVHVWADSDEAIAARSGEMKWASRIEQALDEEKFVLLAQDIRPISGPAKGRHTELLLRMKHEDGSLISPSAFLPSAERFSLASRIDRWVLAHAIDWVGRSSELADLETVAINLSGQSVGDRAFHQHATEVLDAAGEEVCSRICFEITETAAVTNLADATSFIEQMRGRKVRVALDDFGAGASSFGYLKRFPVDYLKIDGQFIRDLTEDPLNEVTVRCFVNVAKVLGINTVAEYVGSPQVLSKLAEIGVDYGQGFYIHRPEPL